MTEELESGGTLAPAAPLAVIDIAVSTSDASSSDEFWARELGFPVADPHIGNRQDVFADLMARWGGTRIGLALREERRGLPERTLWIATAPEGAGARTVVAACAAAVLAVASRTLPRSHGIGAWHGPRERGFGHFARARPWLRETGGTPRAS